MGGVKVGREGLPGLLDSNSESRNRGLRSFQKRSSHDTKPRWPNGWDQGFEKA